MRTRPTSDRLRETLFNVLVQRIDENTRFLDLCAGTGAVGIEALSRGAKFVTFVDRSRKSCGLVEANLDLLKIPEEQTEVVMSEAEDFLKRERKRIGENEAENGWDIAFLDPPYAADYKPILWQFSEPDSNLLRENGVVIAEHHHKAELPDAVQHLRRWRVLKQGDSALSFYERS